MSGWSRVSVPQAASHARPCPAHPRAAGLALYGHIALPLLVIAASWGIVLFAYSLQVPANRMGNAVYPVVQRKTIPEIISQAVFAGFSIGLPGQPLKWTHDAAFAILVGAAFLMF